MEDLLKQMSIEPKEFMDHLHVFTENGKEFTIYNLAMDDEEFKSKSDLTERGYLDYVKDLQDIPLKTIHQTTLKYIYKNCKDDLMQWYQQVGAIPWNLQKKLASDASQLFNFHYNIQFWIGWIKKVIPVIEVLNEKNEKVIHFQDKMPRYLDLYFLQMINFLFIDTITYERWQDDNWDHWDNGGMEVSCNIDFTIPEEVMYCINDCKSE